MEKLLENKLLKHYLIISYFAAATMWRRICSFLNVSPKISLQWMLAA